MKGWKKISVFLCIAVMLITISGCSSVIESGKGTALDIDYVGADGEITEEEVTAESGGLMDWLKSKLSSDKKNAGRATGGEKTEEPAESGIRAAYGLEDTETDSAKAEEPDKTEEEVSKQQADTDGTAIPVKDNPDEDAVIPLPEQNKTEKPNETKPSDSSKNTVTFTIRCDTAVNNGMHKESKWAGIVPASGCILPVTTMEFEEGETVFDLLCRVRDTYKLQMEYSGASGGEYIEGINNLYEFDGGRWSGWMYCVNDWYPNYGCGQYTVKAGDVIEWNYTCDLGCDLENGDPYGWGQEWKDTHD